MRNGKPSSTLTRTASRDPLFDGGSASLEVTGLGVAAIAEVPFGSRIALITISGTPALLRRITSEVEKLNFVLVDRMWLTMTEGATLASTISTMLSLVSTDSAGGGATAGVGAGGVAGSFAEL